MKGPKQESGRGSPRLLCPGVESVTAYYTFMLVSSAFRSYESGIVSSEIPAIKADLGLTYARQGVVAAASDYGLLPSGLLAMVILTSLSAYHVLTTAYLLIGVISVFGIVSPSFGKLVVTRLLTSLLWGMAAVHYPAWVNGHGDKKGKTMRLTILNVMMLVGILGGYLIGGIARWLGNTHWTRLYMVEAILMLTCVLCNCVFSPGLVQATREGGAEKEASDVEETPEVSPASERTRLVPAKSTQKPSGSRWLPAELVSVCTCPLYLCAVAISAAISGTVGFVLYFITQVAEEAIGFDRGFVNVVVGVVFVLGPVGGNIGGGWWLSKCGGYQNYQRSFRLVLLWCFCAWVCSAFLPLATALRSQVFFVAAIFGLLFFGAATVPAINGAAVDAVPGRAAATFGSGIQFFCQHLFKMIAPMAGGRLIDRLGLGTGFSVMVIVLGGILNASAFAGYMVTRGKHSMQSPPTQAVSGRSDYCHVQSPGGKHPD